MALVRGWARFGEGPWKNCRVGPGAADRSAEQTLALLAETLPHLAPSQPSSDVYQPLGRFRSGSRELGRSVVRVCAN